MATQVLKIGSKLAGGEVKAIFKDGVTVLKGSYVRFCLKDEVEKELKRKGVTK